jgi:hypothetical protein
MAIVRVTFELVPGCVHVIGNSTSISPGNVLLLTKEQSKNKIERDTGKTELLDESGEEVCLDLASADAHIF